MLSVVMLLRGQDLATLEKCDGLIVGFPVHTAVFLGIDSRDSSTHGRVDREAEKLGLELQRALERSTEEAKAEKLQRADASDCILTTDAIVSNVAGETRIQSFNIGGRHYR
jgi:hypothetical protein